MELKRRSSLWGTIRSIFIIFIIVGIAVGVNMIISKDHEVADIKNKDDSIQASPTIEEKIEIVSQVKNVKIIAKPQITEQPKAITPPQPISVNLEDRELLARLVYLEGNTESIECQRAIASVVINRVNSGYWGNTLHSVIYAKNQFTPASRIPYTTPTATNYEAVDYILTNGVTIPPYVLYFRAGYHFNWSGYIPYTAINNTYFGYMAKDKQ